MTDPQDRIDYFETLHKMDDATKLILDAVKLIVAGGPDMVKVVAESDPAIILTGLQTLADVVELQRKDINDLNEKLFEIYDEIEKAANAIGK